MGGCWWHWCSPFQYKQHNQNIERTGSVMEKSYKEFMEAKVKSWKDMKDRNVIRAADKFKKKMRKN